MGVPFTEGVEKYGPANSNSTAVVALLTQNEWTTANGATLVSAVGFPGVAIQLSAGGAVVKTLGANLSQAVGCTRFSSSLGSTIVQFLDTGASQCYITVEATGVIALRNGSGIVDSGAVISANSVHCLSWDITFGAAAAYEVWLDGASLFSGTSDTATGTANDYANQIKVEHATSGSITFRDFYLDTGVSAPTTNPKILTSRPTADSAVDFTPTSGVLGQAYSATASVNAPSANVLILRKFTPAINCTINSVSCMPQTTTAGKARAVIYSDSAGAANTLLSTGTEVIGTTAGSLLTGALVTPQSLTASTAYWVGFILDTNLNLALVDGGVTGYKATNTYTSGAPSTAPAMTSGQTSWMIYGNLTGMAVNWPEVSLAPPVGDASYVLSSFVSDEDLFTVPSVGTPDFVYMVAVKSNMRKSDTGVRTIDLQLKSGGTTDSGDTAGQSPGNSYGWLASYYPQDPDTSMDWDAAGVNASTVGYKIAS